MTRRQTQRIARYEAHGWPLALLRLLDANPLVSLSEALERISK